MSEMREPVKLSEVLAHMREVALGHFADQVNDAVQADLAAILAANAFLERELDELRKVRAEQHPARDEVVRFLDALERGEWEDADKALTGMLVLFGRSHLAMSLIERGFAMVQRSFEDLGVTRVDCRWQEDAEGRESFTVHVSVGYEVGDTLLEAVDELADALSGQADEAASPSLARALQLKTYVLYEHPLDHPGRYVVRCHYTRMDGTVEASPSCALFDSLAEAREHCRGLGLAQVARHPSDDPVIVETWV